LRELHFRAHEAALGTFLVHRLVPGDEVARLVRARIERGAAFARAPLHQLAAVLGTEDAGRHGLRAATLRERGAAEELSAASLPDHHRRATQVARDVGHHGLGLLAFDRTRVL